MATGDPPPVTTTSTPGTAATRSCSAPAAGYRIEYPGDWFANDPAQATPCRFFHPVPFTVPPNSESVGIAVAVKLEPVPFADIVPSAGSPGNAEVLARRGVQVAGRPGVRLETRSTSGALRPDGVKGVVYLVDLGARTLVATTYETAAAGTFVANAKVLDRMIASLALLPAATACSASASPPPVAQPGLPSPVAATRNEILAAARACDFEDLDRLARRGGNQFSYSFGADGDPAGFWRRAEAAGRPVLGDLAALLGLPFAARPTAGGQQWVWPSAYAYDRWADVPPTAKEALAPLYGKDDLRRFEQFGAYTGYRVGVGQDGDWLFFVGGD